MQLCIHGHFYQPPREDPISDYIPDEIGAEPFQNWNMRILSECYEPNVRKGNFQKISFNVGPTLFRWIEKFAVETNEKLVSQERSNFTAFGVGNGMAQAYNHIILPLANRQDKITQIRWGIEDFRFRFGHDPVGMWLPETAVDLETLEILFDCGIKFTILAPWQVQAEPGEGSPYLIELSGNRKPFIVFCYDQELSTRVSFHPKSTENGDLFLQSVLWSRSAKNDELILIASDGELYGHHQQFRDLFLSYILDGGGTRHQIDWTYPAKWLLTHEVKHHAKLLENTSWSCLHGTERWKNACGCTPLAHWKLPLRTAFDKIGQIIDQVYMDELSGIFDDPWELRHRYIDVLLGKCSVEALCQEMAVRPLKTEDTPKIDLLLQAQYEKQRMFTSCGFFFDEFHRIEPQNNIAYAAKAIWLIKEATGLDFGSEAMELLRNVRSQKTGLRGDVIYSQTLLRAQSEFEN